MHGTLPKYQSPTCKHGDSLQDSDYSIGDLFRNYGEQYIKTYHPYHRQIKLIRSIRVCRTPALGGKKIKCKTCGEERYIYFSCGNSQCPICQGLKRMQWEDRLNSKLLKVPYVHTVFTLPHQLNGLARQNKTLIYGLLMRTAWKTVKKLTADEKYLGALPGMTSVLHTFGSDLKYHIHVHCLITFGGLKGKKWKWPKNKKILVEYTEYCTEYRDTFLEDLKILFAKGKINYHREYADIHRELSQKRWVVHSKYPTSDPKIISEYLARYICRTGVSRNKLHFDRVHDKVTITYNEYKNQEEGKAAPKKYKHLDPLVAIDQILQHLTPRYFQKSRHQGLHHPSTRKKVEGKLPKSLKQNGDTVRKMFELMTIMLGYSVDVCQECGGTEFEEEIIPSQSDWIKPILLANKSSPKRLVNMEK